MLKQSTHTHTHTCGATSSPELLQQHAISIHALQHEQANAAIKRIKTNRVLEKKAMHICGIIQKKSAIKSYKQWQDQYESSKGVLPSAELCCRIWYRSIDSSIW